MKEITEILHILYEQESPEPYRYVWLVIGIIVAVAVFRIICFFRKNKRINRQTDFKNWNTENLSEPISESALELQSEQEPAMISQNKADRLDLMEIIKEVETELAQRAKQRKEFYVTSDNSSDAWSWTEDFEISDPDSFFMQREKTQKKKEKWQNSELAGEMLDSVNMLKDDWESRETQDCENTLNDNLEGRETQD